jgi:hypothetical protein
MKFTSNYPLFHLSLCIVTSLLAGSQIAVGQAAATGFRVFVPATQGKDGIFEFAVENVSKLTITAARTFQSCSPGTNQSQVSGYTGFDTLQTFSLKAVRMSPGIAPGERQEFYAARFYPKCSQQISLLFSDGHGEGSDDSSYGWHKMIADRYSAYDELLHTKNLVEAIDANAPDFIHKLLKALDSRGAALGDRHARVSRSEVSSREHVLYPLVTELKGSDDQMPLELKTREGMLQLLEQWMEPLQKDGYDKSSSLGAQSVSKNSP